MEESVPLEASPAGQGTSELRTRVLSALVLGTVALAATIAGGMAFVLLVVAFAAVGFWEWTAITGADTPTWARRLLAACLAAGIVALGAGFWPLGGGLMLLAAAAAVAAGMAHRNVRWMGAGIAYVGLPAAAFVLIREGGPSGLIGLLYVLLIVWATDIGAYFGGRSIGGPKLWPRVSPKKTWSGALCGLAAGMATGAAIVAAGGVGSVLLALLLAAPLSIAAQAGDLFESSIKRRFGVKDSGRSIPGHGGVLDRVDGLFGAAAMALLFAAVGIDAGVLSLPGAGR